MHGWAFVCTICQSAEVEVGPGLLGRPIEHSGEGSDSSPMPTTKRHTKNLTETLRAGQSVGVFLQEVATPGRTRTVMVMRVFKWTTSTALDQQGAVTLVNDHCDNLFRGVGRPAGFKPSDETV